MTSLPAHDELSLDGIRISAQAFGDSAAPALLLIGGAEASMEWWDEEFCRRLADGGRYVIRYDTRDTGRSTTYPVGEPGYGADDLVADALGVLDAFGIAVAHIAGVSMGGRLAQRLALTAPARVVSLTLIASTPATRGEASRPALPPMSDALARAFAEGGATPDWSDRDAVIDHYVQGEHLFAGTLPVDEEWVRRIVGQAWDRSPSMASAANHYLADDGAPLGVGLDAITAPTLVLHGTADPLFPFAHGEALAREIPGARLVPLTGMGHGMPPREVWDVAIPAILEISAGGAR